MTQNTENDTLDNVADAMNRIQDTINTSIP